MDGKVPLTSASSVVTNQIQGYCSCFCNPLLLQTLLYFIFLCERIIILKLGSPFSSFNEVDVNFSCRMTVDWCSSELDLWVSRPWRIFQHCGTLYLWVFERRFCIFHEESLSKTRENINDLSLIISLVAHALSGRQIQPSDDLGFQVIDAVSRGMNRSVARAWKPLSVYPALVIMSNYIDAVEIITQKAHW